MNPIFKYSKSLGGTGLKNDNPRRQWTTLILTWEIYFNMPHHYNSSTISWQGEAQVNKQFTKCLSKRTEREVLSSHNPQISLLPHEVS